MTKPKYKQGRKLTAAEAVDAIAAGEFIYWREKITHPGWAQNWQTRMLIKACQSGIIREAVKLEEGDEA